LHGASLRILGSCCAYISLLGYMILSVPANRKTYVFKWWSVVEVKYTDGVCRGSEYFYGVGGLGVLCKDLILADWIARNLPSSGYTPVVVPAQALFYRHYKFNKHRQKFLTISWNDFSNHHRQKMALADLMDKLNCRVRDGSRYAVLLFRTNDADLSESEGLFMNSAHGTSSMQRLIEAQIAKIGSNGCTSSVSTMYDNKSVILVFNK
jgi:hypothetical protein